MFRSSPHFGSSYFISIYYVLILTRKTAGLHFGRFFSQTHLVTLLTDDRESIGSNSGKKGRNNFLVNVVVDHVGVKAAFSNAVKQGCQMVYFLNKYLFGYNGMKNGKS
jgi:hypothetical protein